MSVLYHDTGVFAFLRVPDDILNANIWILSSDSVNGLKACLKVLILLLQKSHLALSTHRLLQSVVIVLAEYPVRFNPSNQKTEKSMFIGMISSELPVNTSYPIAQARSRIKNGFPDLELTCLESMSFPISLK